KSPFVYLVCGQQRPHSVHRPRRSNHTAAGPPPWATETSSTQITAQLLLAATARSSSITSTVARPAKGQLVPIQQNEVHPLPFSIHTFQIRTLASAGPFFSACKYRHYVELRDCSARTHSDATHKSRSIANRTTDIAASPFSLMALVLPPLASDGHSCFAPQMRR
ncbi:14308_t:CDS:2, partial [Acaulospora colombiana]